MGSALSDIHRRAAAIAGTASSAEALLSGAEMEGAAARLREILDGMDAILSRSLADIGRNEEALRTIRAALGGVLARLPHFGKIVKRLRILGITTRIESARLGDGGFGFGTLAGHVDDLSELIEKKTAMIEACAREADKAVSQALLGAAAHAGSQRGRTRTIHDETTAHVALMTETRARSAAAAAAVSGRIAEESRRIGEIVASLQFHDITRQQLEHVAMAVSELADKLADARAGKVPGSPGPAEAAVLARDVCDLQIAHIASAGKAFDQAVHGVIENLKGICETVEGISAQALETAGTMGRTGATALSGLEAGIARIANDLRESAAAAAGLDGVMGKAAGAIEEIYAFVNDIEEIGQEIEMVALNAGIKAARTGEQGAALGVLADAIQRLSVDARARTTASSQALRDIREAAAGLRPSSVPGAGGDGPGRDEASLAGDLGVLLESLHGTNARVGALLEELDRSFRGLSGDIEGIVGAISVHETVARGLEEASAVLCGLRDHVRNHSREGTAGGTVSVIENLATRYTMHRERDIHEAVVRRAAPPPAHPGAGVSLGSGEFGDNVEIY